MLIFFKEIQYILFLFFDPKYMCYW